MPPIPASDITLGILAGGRASRLGGVDKAWLQRDGLAQVERWRRRFADGTGAILISANRHLERYERIGLHVVADRSAGDLGPLAGLDALAAACGTPWLLTLPVDLVGVNDGLLPSLGAAAHPYGAFAVDDDGPQPLVALWPTLALRDAATHALASRELAVHPLQRRLRMLAVRLDGVRFGNLNTPQDLAAAGAVPRPSDESHA
ncbi:NTP transferase domain-containing protein [Lysobacter arvi]|uniref:Molybdenum cofactor guanylyltransferase n=1 Tax=Lysobacter arvi TaxID=3038776 RepID=A0ABU1CCR5_9GAMM|nr:NTP transferase domain-containing protein [Lysobacter arvi]MDR0182199.1 NTP transferase domain-containing protein [Lysobacter arvi]